MFSKRSLIRYVYNTRDTLLLGFHSFINISWKSNTDLFQIFMAMASLSWSALLFHGGLGGTFVEPEYHIMAHYANEYVWGLLFLIQGVCGLVTTLLKSKNIIVSLTSSILGCILWTASCVSIFLSVSPPPADISAGLITAWFSWWLLLRIPLDR